MSGRILVTGASGFIGRRLVAALADAGKGVLAASREPSRVPARKGVDRVAVSDFERAVDWRPVLSDVAAVVHLAGIAHVGSGIGADAYDRVNRQATAELAAACAAAGVRRFIFLSSVRAQCGPSAPHVLTERDAPRPTEPYGRSKLAAEETLRASGLAWTILRPALVYGPGVKGNLATLLRIARLPLPLPLAAFSARRSLLGIDNLTAAILHVLDAPRTVGCTYLAADPEPLSLPEIVTALRSGMGRRPGLYALPSPWLAAGLKLAGRRDLWERLAGALVVEPSALMATGWRPTGDSRAGLARMAAAGP